jgi:hypothetical protein
MIQTYGVSYELFQVAPVAFCLVAGVARQSTCRIWQVGREAKDGLNSYSPRSR